MFTSFVVVPVVDSIVDSDFHHVHRVNNVVEEVWVSVKIENATLLFLKWFYQIEITSHQENIIMEEFT